ncbi:hypothetical protein BO71DRAFT_398959 [Aspergillus ellipticus CBS 707.79]|uniref:Uncharacterized protein n=1 Tax=Aspergillus ellipticus CBS 707.79 TaxID=1448320 RepID=A0A319DSK3_9EURO|nr:hypothetical protein BO71DRAFT_398959 [Aspergillus ellipticus CBS 707.79]
MPSSRSRRERLQLAWVYREVEGNESQVEFFVEEKVPHDVLMIGWIMGFKDEARPCVIRAEEFLGQVDSAHDSWLTV